MIREELVARQLDEQIVARFEVGRRLRVLDVGLGEGTQALRLARAGHQVTGLEADPALLDVVRAALEEEPEGIRERFRVVPGTGQDTGAHFLPGTFDVVLCHGVLMESRDPDSTLAGLARVLDAGGLLSLVVRNESARAMRPGLAGDWEAALGAFSAGDRAFRLDALSTVLQRIGTPLERWYGVDVFAARTATAEDERVLAAEELAGREDPYRSVAALLHLFGVRG
ncbi:class I SAM-dependent methyltransferase [Streptomyces boncukensis]|uniref:Methyltransferase domain-containing protein n=1 Tax=Streptomyces boncukensis TaxID=2711219 RepID=A0A6G4X4E4_9ACTN|nr:methyltransferase domain-containing protein [Streptomyces boncukensis]NGO71750.1 methyltransferase domain-containing protein [Streptomyces boncukensis]